MSGPDDHGPTLPPEPAKELQARAAQGAVWTVLHTFISLGVGFLVNLVVARYLGVADFGRLATITLAVELSGTIFNLGVGNSLVQMGSKAHATGRRDEVRALLSGSQGYRILAELPLSLLVAAYVGWSGNLPASAFVWILLFGVLLPQLTAGAAACIGIENRTARGAQLVLASSILVNLITLAVVVLGGDTVMLWGARLAVGSVIPIVALGLVSRDYRGAVLRPRIPPRLGRPFWHYAIPVWAATTMGSLVSSRSEVLLLTWVGSADSVGTYALAFGLVTHVFAPATALTGPLLPAVSALREVSAANAVPAFLRFVRIASSVAGVLVAAAIPALAALVPLLYGTEYAPASAVVVVLGVLGISQTLIGPLYAFSQARLAGRLLLVSAVLALLVDVVIAVALIPRFGAWGAVAAMGAAGMVQVFVLARSELAELGLTWVGLVAVMANGLLAAPAALLAWAASSVVSSPLLGAIVAGAVGLLGWAGLARSLGSGLRESDVVVLCDALPGPIARFLKPVLGFVAHR